MTVQSVSPAPQARTGSMPTTGRWGWYRDHEGREHRRASKLVKKVETDTYNLDEWYKRQVAEGLAIRDDLVLALKAMGRPGPEGWSREQKKTINGICKAAAEAAKQRDGAKVGTAFHTLTERVDRGEPVEQVAAGLPAEAAQTIRAYAAMRELNGWQTVEVERTVVLDELEVAGTFDRVELIPGLAALLGPGVCQYGDEHVHGSGVELPVIADVKTEEAPWLNGLHIGPQLGIYSRARKMWRPTGGTHTVVDDRGDEHVLPNGEYVPAPCVRQDVGVVVHLRAGRSVPYFINLIEGWEAAQAAYAQMNRESRAKRKLGAAGCWFAAVPGIVEPPLLQTFIDTAVAAGHADPNRPGSGQVGEVVTVGGIDFTRKVAADDVAGAFGTANGSGCTNCDPLWARASATRVDGTVPEDRCRNCHRLAAELPPAGPLPVREEQAVRGPDGLVRWESKTSAEMAGLPGAPEAERQFDEHDELRRLLIEAIWRAVTTDGLAILWNMARDRGVPWTGPVELAANARARQISCPQRELHKGTGKCACGWTLPVPA